MSILVIDVSQYQPANIDYAPYVAAGVRGVYVQATQGAGFVNPNFQHQVEGAVLAGLAVGAYHFCRPDHGLASQQVGFFRDRAFDLVGNAPATMPPMADVELPLQADWAKAGLTAKGIAQWAVEFVDASSQAWGKACGVYTFPAYWRALPADVVGELYASPLWLAEYPISGAVTGPPIHNVPTVAPWRGAALWQFTDHYQLPGTPRVDCSVLAGGEDEWAAFLKA